MSLADLPHRFRDSTSDWRSRLRTWRSDVQADPSLLWRTPAIRITLWILFGGLLYWSVASGVSTISGGFDGDAQRERTATLFVACTEPACLHAATVTRPISFREWPLTCQRCGKASVQRGKPCGDCRRWFAPADAACPHCAAAAKLRKPIEKPRRSTDPDDAEDDW